LEEALAERRKAQQADRAKSAFLSNMSHELRTPLNAMLGFAQLLDRDSEITFDQRESIGVILRSGEHLLGLINDVLALAKIEAGRASLSLEPFEPRLLVRKLEDMLRVKVKAKGIELGIEVAESLPEAVEGDSGRLTQVLLNLLGNAVKFTDQGRVDLRASWNDGRLRFEVADTGPGISESDLPHLFEPFAQTEAGRRAEEGSGLGLAISRKLVSLMGGELTVASEPGKGSTFAFDVPLELSDGVVPTAERERVTGVAPGQPAVRVLVVDDAAENRDLLRRLHTSVGIETRTAENGRKAVEIWGSWRPEFIWMDMRMPELDGYEATRRIRRAEAELEVRRTLIVALTATAFEHDRQRILSAGCDDVVIKPFREGVLFAKLEEHLGLRFLTRKEPVARDPAPSSSEQAATASSRGGDTPGRPAADPLRILVAEDNPANQVVARRMLERLGYRVDLVDNGRSAFRAAKNGAYDLVFMDIRMP
ncbi:MAG: response regulator, partial [Holophagales bacterium]|nr:response regulator [Holophagales bacterium]